MMHCLFSAGPSAMKHRLFSAGPSATKHYLFSAGPSAMKHSIKNPSYGRQIISQPMPEVAFLSLNFF